MAHITKIAVTLYLISFVFSCDYGDYDHVVPKWEAGSPLQDDAWQWDATDESVNFIFSVFEELTDESVNPDLVYVEWMLPGECYPPGGNGDPIPALGWEGTCYLGLTWNCKSIYVMTTEDETSLADTALAHELFHCWLLETENAGDRDHVHPLWKEMFGDGYVTTKMREAGL